MKIATWNVNSVRARLPGILDWLQRKGPDLVCLQEIKCQDHQFPGPPIEELGYNVETFGQKTWNGVALLSKEPMSDLIRGLPGEDAAAERRLIGATVGDLIVLCVLVVHGREPGTEKFACKLRWLENLRDFLAEHCDLLDERFPQKVVVAGDFNITFDDRDVHDPEAWLGRIHCTPEEREALESLMELGLFDAFREFHEEGGHFTWWDFKTRAFSGNRGLRIDHILMSKAALQDCRGVEIDREERAKEKPSDHAPLIASLQGGTGAEPAALFASRGFTEGRLRP